MLFSFLRLKMPSFYRGAQFGFFCIYVNQWIESVHVRSREQPCIVARTVVEFGCK